MSRCLVIGGNGFIGSYVVDALARDGHDVTVFDRFSSGLTFYEACGVRQVVGDFLNHAVLAEALRGQDYVFHFLSTTSPAISENEPTLDIRTNISQSVDLFAMCVDRGIKRLFFASTGGAIYGDQGQRIYNESDVTLPISPYAIGKLTLENYLGYFRLKHGLESVCLRISNPYGPRQHANRKQGLIPIALRQVALGRPVVRFGRGDMVRDYIYVEDVGNMVAAMTEVRSLHNVYNIGSGLSHSVNDVLDTIRLVTNQDFDVVQEEVPSTYVGEVVLDTSRYSAEFKVPNLRSIQEGISLTWNTEV